MLKKLLLSLALLIAPFAFAGTATFTDDGSGSGMTINDNPERGFYSLHETNTPYWCDGTLGNETNGFLNYINGSGTQPIQPVRLMEYKWGPGVTSAFGFTKSSAQVTADLACVRAAGAKVIFTIVYCDTSSTCDEGVTLSQALADIVTLGTIAKANRDVIDVIRMGTIGGFGEWFGSFRGFDTATNKRSITDAYVANMPPEIPIVIRESPTLQAWFPTPITKVGGSLTGSYQSRIGTYTDCFLAGGNDATYKGTIQQPGGTGVQWTGTETSQRVYAATHNNYTQFGAEICDNFGGSYRTNCDYGSSLADNSGLPPNNGAAGIMNEGPRYHLSYVHRGFGLTQINTWIAQGCYGQVNSLMGYRFVYKTLVTPSAMTRGTAYTLNLTMQNYGWARMHSPRQVQARFVNAADPTNTAKQFTCVFPQQLRTLDPNASTTTALQTTKCIAPAALTTGTYNIMLEMPDITWPGLSTPSAAFKARTANPNSGSQIWDTGNRWMNTGLTATIS